MKINKESGNVLFYILIAVALLAALSYAIAYGSRIAVQNLDEDRLRLLASEVIGYSDNIATAVSQLRLRGFDPSEISFETPQTAANDYINTNCADNTCLIFHPAGAGLLWNFAPSQALDTIHSAETDYEWWSFSAHYDVKEVGTNCAGDSCKDLVLYLNYLRRDVCIQINEFLGINNPGDLPPEEDGGLDPMNNHFKGTFSNLAGEVTGKNAEDLAALNTQKAACVSHTTPVNPTYIFYQVLVPR
jgi:hypothetical protein